MLWLDHKYSMTLSLNFFVLSYIYVYCNTKWLYVAFCASIEHDAIFIYSNSDDRVQAHNTKKKTKKK